jgi:hypothetical protein
MLTAVNEEHECSCCGTKVEKLAVKSDNSDKVICHNCVYDLQVVLGKLPAGALQCARCGFYQFVVAHYANNLKVAFAYLSQDDKGTAVYGAVQSSAAWDRRSSKFLHADCGQCAKKIPFKRIWESPYILPHEQRVSPMPPEPL